jgi:excisionase family DNA binding protein
VRISRIGQGSGHAAGLATKLLISDRTGREAMWNGHPSDGKLLTKGEVALLCRVEIRTVDRWVASGKLRHYRIPSGRLLFRETDVLVMASPIAATGS